MKKNPPEDCRITAEIAERLGIQERLISDERFGMNGMFYLRLGKETLRCMVSDGGGWEHVSVSLSYRCPTWAEMCHVKSVFWEESECVMQLHPPKEDWINNHPYVLHLWRPTATEIPRPPGIMVGIKGVSLKP